MSGNVTASGTNSGKVEGQQRRSFGHRVLSLLGLLLVNFVVFAVLAELASIVIVHLKRWPASRPTYHVSKPFWGDINPVFGIWHYPDGVFYHQGACFDVTYHTDSYGARDTERTLQASQPRTIVLGDSFVEGLDSSDQQRLTNLLEQQTGREHLNFGTSGGFSPLQYALLYRSLASRFDHKLVVVGVFPDNDFHEMDASWLNKNYAGEYRPYYAPDLSVKYLGHFDPKAGDSLWDRTESVMRGYLASYHVGQYLYGTRLYWKTRDHYSGYNDYNDVDLARLKNALLDIQATAKAKGADMVVFIIPAESDFERLHSAGTNRVGPALESWGAVAGIPVKDLLPPMEAEAKSQFGGNERGYFLPCDGHWSPRGSAATAAILEPWLYSRK